MIATLEDGSVLWVTRTTVEHRAADGTVLARREPTAADLAQLEAWIATQPAISDAAWAERVADATLGASRAEVRAAAARLAKIRQQGAALAGAAALPTATAAQVQAAVVTLDTRQHAIGQALADVAAILLEVGRVVLRDPS